MEMRTTVEVIIDRDVTITSNFTRIIDTDDEAHEFGVEAAGFMSNFSKGFGAWSKDNLDD